MNIGPINITTKFRKLRSYNAGLPARDADPHEKGAFNGDTGDNNGTNNILGSDSLRRNLKRITPALAMKRKPTLNSNIENGRNSPLFHRLSGELQELSQHHQHVWGYLCSLPVDQIGIPDYHPHLNKTLRKLEYHNLIYPVDESTFIHIYPDNGDSRDIYVCVEPILGHLSGLMEQVDKRLIDFVEELK